MHASRSDINVRQSERWASAVTGAALAALGVKRLTEDQRPAGVLLATTGAGLIWRGATGHCSIYEAAGISTAHRLDTREALGGTGGVAAEEAVTINGSPLDLYRAWRDLELLPQIFPDLQSVEARDDRHSH